MRRGENWTEERERRKLDEGEEKTGRRRRRRENWTEERERRKLDGGEEKTG